MMLGIGQDHFQSSGLHNPLGAAPGESRSASKALIADLPRSSWDLEERPTKAAFSRECLEGATSASRLEAVYLLTALRDSSVVARGETCRRTSLQAEAGTLTGMFSGTSPFRGRLTGPVKFVKKLLETWKLDEVAAVPLLGFEQSDLPYVTNVLNGCATLRGRDAKDRIAYLFQVRKTLSALFQSEDVENEWLREPHTVLHGKSPMDLLQEGSMENLLLVKEYVETVAGR